MDNIRKREHVEMYSIVSHLRRTRERLLTISPEIRNDQDYIELLKNINEALNRMGTLVAKYGNK